MRILKVTFADGNSVAIPIKTRPQLRDMERVLTKCHKRGLAFNLRNAATGETLAHGVPRGYEVLAEVGNG